MVEKRKTKIRKRYIKKKSNKTMKNKCVYTDEGIRIKKLIEDIKRANNKKK
jgi:hypothetical protein